MERFIQRIAVAAGKAAVKKFGKVGVKYTKETPEDVVTEADLLANRIIVGAIRKNYPEHGIISEEMPGEGEGSEYVWTIDPIDGTRNFVTGVPLFCVMVSLARRGNTQLAVIYDPVHKELFYAKKGQGAFLNGKHIHCSRTAHWKGSYGSCSIKTNGKYGKVKKVLLEKSKREDFWMSAFGSVGITGAYLAAGRRDWCYSFNPSLWDWAGPALIMKEAGCVVTNTEGKPWRPGDAGIVAGNKHLQPQLLAMVKKALKG